MTPKKLGTAILCSALLAAASLYGQASAPAVQPTDSAVSPTKDDVATLKQQLAEQQKEIDALKAAVEAQNKMMMMQRATNAAPASGSITPGTTTAHNTPD